MTKLSVDDMAWNCFSAPVDEVAAGSADVAKPAPSSAAQQMAERVKVLFAQLVQENTFPFCQA